MRPSLGRAVLGGAAIVAGAVLFLSVIGDVDAGAVLGRWWPLVLIALGLVQVATERRLRIGSTVLLGIGLLLLASTTGLIDASVWPVLGAVALIVVGALVMAPRSSREVTVAGAHGAGGVVVGGRGVKANPPRVRRGGGT
ncbi:MAG: hypothetical protein ABWY62_02695, partial [Acidimicrobiia bacterium]